MTTEQPQTMVIYREEKTQTWFKVKDILDLHTEMTVKDGVTLVFHCQAFGNSRSGAFTGEMVVLQCHDHSTDVRYAAQVMFEYLSDDQLFLIRANAREAILPDVPVEWKNLVLSQNHMLHYTGDAMNINPFLALVSNNQLTLENSQLLGSQTIIPVESAKTQSQTWGRYREKPVPKVENRVVVPRKTWFDRLFRRA